MEPVFFPAPEALKTWLERYDADTRELHVGFYKKGSGKPSVTWPEAVDEALCVGWIDGVRRSLGKESYAVRFTPRKTGSIWSAVNIRRVEALTAQGRMRTAGLAAFAQRQEARSKVYAYEQQNATELPEELARRFQESTAAWEWFEEQAAWYRRTAIWRVVNAKQATTRWKRLEQLVRASEQRKRW